MMRYLCMLVLWTSALASAECPDTGQIRFRHVVGAPAVYVQGLFGEDSYQAFLLGNDFSQAQRGDGARGNLFSLGGFTFEHFALPRQQYLLNQEQPDEAAELAAHHDWELKYMEGLSESGKIKLEGHRSYGVVETEIIDGSKRKFFIWYAELSGARQYFVTTRLSFGVLVLSILGVEPQEEERVRDVIQNYMYRFTKLREPQCTAD